MCRYTSAQAMCGSQRTKWEGYKDSVFVGLRDGTQVDRLGTKYLYSLSCCTELSKFVVYNFMFCYSSYLVLVLCNLKCKALPVSVGNHNHLTATFEENLILTFRKPKRSCFRVFEGFIFISFKIMFIY